MPCQELLRSGTYPYTMNMTSTSYTGGVTYSSSCFIKTNVAYKFNYFGTGMNYVNQAMTKAGTSFSIAQPDGSLYVGRSNFAYTATTTQVGYLLTNPINNTTFNASTDFVWFKNGQVELGEFPTSFAGDSTTRSNTEALVDLTGNHTLTSSSGVIYNSDGTFSFTTTANTSYFDLNSQNIISGTNPFTIEAWTNKTSGSYGEILGNYGSGYSTGLWFATAGLYIVGSVYHTDYANSMAGIHHSAATRDSSGNVKLYRDGVLVSTGTLTSSIPSNINFRIGADVNGGAESLGGNIYNVKVYNQVLTAAEVTQNFNALRGRYGI